LYHNPEDNSINSYAVIFEEEILDFPTFECVFACVMWDKYFLKGKASEKIKALDKFKEICQSNMNLISPFQF
jgi:hypothetical protein